MVRLVHGPTRERSEPGPRSEEPYKINSTVQSLKSGQQPKPSYDSIDDIVKTSEVAIKIHRVVTNTMDWHLNLAVSQVDNLTQNADPRDKVVLT